MMYPLWGDTNTSVYSSVFTVPAGKVAVLIASGLLADRVRVCPGEFKSKQSVCIRRVIYGFDAAQAGGCAPCGYIFDPSKAQATMIHDEPVRTCGVTWGLTCSKNIGIIGVPGVYRLRLNDETAVGVAQIYIEQFDNSAVAAQVESLFFA